MEMKQLINFPKLFINLVLAMGFPWVTKIFGCKKFCIGGIAQVPKKRSLFMIAAS
ncbi:hypothetical protein COLO4_30454 [Corchorus olitorius]|uniref:Uncharacterized protein n=1 Tax=Corchorus olitorius TaxID=93759 RepID=A0A1R3H8V8_9ROSI|nr:hypothetical protein COLO4_30454 [Corchorus olitorius]